MGCTTSVDATSLPTDTTVAEIEQIFVEGHTTYAFDKSKPVADELLTRLVELTSLGPTAMNACPIRITFAKSEEAIKKISQAGQNANVNAALGAPVIAILSYDEEFFRYADRLYPKANGQLGEKIRNTWPAENVKSFYTLNSRLQAAYFIVAARSLGLSTGPKVGFNFSEVDKIVNKTEAESSHKAFLAITLGYPAPHEYTRGPRFAPEEISRIE